MTSKNPVICFVTKMLAFYLSTAVVTAQNPPTVGDPYAARGNPKSPDGKYAWIVRTTSPLGYDLLNVATGQKLVALNAYYPEANDSNIRYAKALGAFWNKDGTIVTVDELNRRRAGYLYFFILQKNGTVREIRAENIIPCPSSADEDRLVVDPGWVSGTTIRVRQALKTKSGEFVSHYFNLDFANSDHPNVEPAE
jgi:hypothetical protein